MLIKLRMALFTEGTWYHYPDAGDGLPAGMVGRWTTGG